MLVDFNLNKEQQEKEVVKIDFIKDIKEGFHYLYERKNIMQLFLVLIFLNFFFSFAVTVPLPYIINTVLDLGSKTFGVIQAALPVGMIAGALVIRRLIENISYSSLWKVLTITLSILMIAVGIPLIFEDASLSYLFYGAYYCVLMFFFGTIIAFIDIPLSYIMQREIPEEYRGRVMSIGISIGKTMAPVAMVVSGLLLELIPPFVLSVSGGILYLLINLRYPQKMTFNFSSKLKSTAN